MDSKDIAAITTEVSKCCCDPAKDCTSEVCSGRCGKVVQGVLILVSLCIGIFDSYTDWNIWVNLNRSGLGLLQASDYFVYPWLAFTIMGTLLVVVSLVVDVLDLVCNLKMCSSGDGWTWGFNSLTCGEVLSFLNLLLEDLPILALTCTYVMIRQFLCLGLNPSIDANDYVSEYRDLFISGVVSTAAIIYRTGRSFYRLCYSYGLCRCCPALDSKEKLCPVKSCARYCCVVPYGISLCCQIFVIILLFFAIGFFVSFLRMVPGAFSGSAPSPAGTPPIDWNITHSHPVASNSNVIGSVRLLIQNGHLSVTEAFHRNLDETTYCLAYFEFHSKEIVFNVANIDRQHSIHQPCLCNPDSTPCDRYYENIFIGAHLPNRYNYTLEDYAFLCPLPVKPLRRNSNLHVNCNCDFSDAVEHLVLW